MKRETTAEFLSRGGSIFKIADEGTLRAGKELTRLLVRFARTLIYRDKYYFVKLKLTKYTGFRIEEHR